MYTAISSIAYIFGPKCYNFLRNYFPLPHETIIRKHISPLVNGCVGGLVNFDDMEAILNEFTIGEKMNAALAIDAAAFKDVKGDSILKKFPELKFIDAEKIYNALFVCYIQPIYIDVKPFPVHIEITEDGSAGQTKLECIDLIINMFKERDITKNYIATDGDHKYDSLQDDFF